MTHMLLLGKANNNRRSLWKLKQLNFPIYFGNCAKELIGLTCLFFFFLSCIFCSVWTNIALVCGETKGDRPKKKKKGCTNSLKSRPGNMILQIISRKQKQREIHPESGFLTRCTQEGQQVSSTQLMGTWVMTCKLSLEKELKMLFFVNIHCYWSCFYLKKSISMSKSIDPNKFVKDKKSLQVLLGKAPRWFWCHVRIELKISPHP